MPYNPRGSKPMKVNRVDGKASTAFGTAIAAGSGMAWGAAKLVQYWLSMPDDMVEPMMAVLTGVIAGLGFLAQRYFTDQRR